MHALGYPGSRYRLHSLGFRVTQGRVEGLSLECWGLGIVVWFRAEGFGAWMFRQRLGEVRDWSCAQRQGGHFGMQRLRSHLHCVQDLPC